MEEEIFFLIQVQLGRETNMDLNTTGNATKTEFKGHGSTVGKLNKKLITFLRP